MTFKAVIAMPGGTAQSPNLQVDDSDTGVNALNAELVAHLALLDPSVNPYISCAGLNIKGLGGGGFAGVDTVAGDSTTSEWNVALFASSNAAMRWRRQLPGERLDGRDSGATGVITQNATAALQALLSAAVGASYAKNKPVVLPAGEFKATGASLVFAPPAIGMALRGAGARATRIYVDRPIKWNGFGYASIEGIEFQASAGFVGNELLDLDHDGTPGTYLQVVRFADCMFSGNGLVNYCTRIGKSVVPMGSNFQFANCLWNGALLACYMQEAPNALGNQIIGGDFQAYPGFGVHIAAGVIMMLGTTMEATLCGRTAAAAAVAGWDIGVEANALMGSQIIGVRSESARFLATNGSHPLLVEACSVVGQYQFNEWLAGHAYVIGDVITGTVANGDGRPYQCTQSGNSGGAEPAWDPGAMVAGAWSAPVFNDGAAKWQLLDYNVIDMTGRVGAIRNSYFALGRVSLGASAALADGPVEISNNIFTRTDWMGANYYALGERGITGPNWVKRGLPWTAGTSQKFVNFPVSPFPNTRWSDYTHRNLGRTPLVFSGPTGDVGLVPYDAGRTLGVFAAAVTPPIPGQPDAPTANTTGSDLVIGGVGTGSANCSRVALATSSPGGAGNTVNPLVRVLEIDELLQCRLRDPVSGTTKPIKLSPVTAGFKNLRIWQGTEIWPSSDAEWVGYGYPSNADDGENWKCDNLAAALVGIDHAYQLVPNGGAIMGADFGEGGDLTGKKAVKLAANGQYFGDLVGAHCDIGAQDFSLTMLLKPNSGWVDPGAGKCFVLVKYSGVAWYSICINATQIDVYLHSAADGDQHYLATPAALWDGHAHLLDVVLDRDGNVGIMWDAEATANTACASPTSLSNVGGLELGNFSVAPTSNFLGMIAGVRVVRSALSSRTAHDNFWAAIKG